MDWLRDFLDRNYEIVIFVYGLTFFVLGLSIALQSRQRSRLHLARSLGWLSLFGITHALYEWGLLFIPLQAAYMNHSGVTLLLIFQVLLLGVSFLALFAFGTDLVRYRWPRLRFIPFLVFSVWLLWLLVTGVWGDLGVGWWRQYGDIAARYFMAFPGALLAAYGLRRQAHQQIKPLQLNRIYKTLQAAGVAFILYAIFAGLMVPYGNFFPANWLNQSLLIDFTGIPVPIYRSLIGLAMVITIVRAMEVFDLETERLIERMEIEQSLAAERERIGRELHDGAIQTVYTAGLIVESARSKVESDTVIAQRLDRAMIALNEAITSLRTYMSNLRPVPAAASLADELREQVENPQLNVLFNTSFVWNVPNNFSFNPLQSGHILAIVTETLANAARHANAQHVSVEAFGDDHQFVLTVTDDGLGFIPAKSKEGYGMRNMRDRARLLGGELDVYSDTDQGTTIRLTIPLEES